MIRIQKVDSTPLPMEKPADCSPLLNLPKELIPLILKWLPPADTFALRVTHKTFQQEILWKQLYIRDFSYRYSSETPALTYYEAYKNAHRVDFNVKKGIYSSSILHKPSKSVLKSIKCLHVFDKKLFMGRFNGDLIIKNSVTGNVLKKIEGMSDTPRALDTFGQVLYVGYDSGTVKAWDTETGKCLNTFKNDKNEGSIVNLICCDGMLIVSLSHNIINIWDTQSNNHIKTLNGDNKHIAFTARSLAVYDGHLFAADRFGKIVIWNMQTWDEVFNRICLKKCASIPFTLSNGEKVVFFFNFFDTFRTPCCTNMLMVKDLNTNQNKCLQGHKDNILLPSFLNGKPLPIASDGKFVFEENNYIYIRNYNPDYRDVSCEIVDQFRSGIKKEIFDANNRFLRMPQKAKNKVYESLCREIYDPSRIALNRYPNSDKDLQVLHQSIWKKLSPKEKAQAIIDSDPSLEQEQWEELCPDAKKQKK